MFKGRSLADLERQKGINLEPYEGQKDRRARTIRITGGLRCVACVPDKKDLLGEDSVILHKIVSHDEAQRWMMNSRFTANAVTGAVEVVDVTALEEIAATAPPEPAATAPEPIFGHRSDSDFTSLGVSAELLPALRSFTDQDQLGGLLTVVPQSQAEALVEMLGYDTVDAIYARIAGDFAPGSISDDDVGEALSSDASRSQFVEILDDDELTRVLDQPMATWRTFLHPTQRRVAYRHEYSGPARVTGGAGTGKTVVALHRAKHLASQLGEHSGTPILFATFNKNLAESIKQVPFALGGPELYDRVDVIHVDSLANRLIREVEGSSPAVIMDSREISDIWIQTAKTAGVERSADFLNTEWEQVILAKRCRSLEDYLSISRVGRGVRLDRRQRTAVWQVAEQFTSQLEERGRRTFLQLSDAATDYQSRRSVRPYRHVIVDEAQDLHPSNWRLLRSLVEEGPNDIFICGDSHQRIYKHQASLSGLGVHIVGRSHKLRINYRTSHEIMRWCLKLLEAESQRAAFDAFDGGNDTHDYAGYHSFMRGPDPQLHKADSSAELAEAVVARVMRWLDDGVEASEIAVVAPWNRDLTQVKALLRSDGIRTVECKSSRPNDQGVRVGSMHSVKGLEFRCVAATAVNSDRLPHPFGTTKEADDPVQHRADVRRERCLLYVACSRARDVLWAGYVRGRASEFLYPHL